MIKSAYAVEWRSMEIKVNDLSVSIKKKAILSDVTFDITSGEMVAITGESGSGKTTLLNCLGLIQSISNGMILIDGNNATRWKDKEKLKFWNKYAAFIYQDYGIIEEESVTYNITLNKFKRCDNDLKTVLEKVGLEGREKEKAIVLSGGEKQRVGIARAILKRAAIIYADEPTASLDASNREVVISLLKECSKQGAIVILATHDDRLAKICDKVIFLGKNKKNLQLV